MKICCNCKTPKPKTAEFFCKKLNGFQAQCKECRNAIRRSQLTREDRDKLNQIRRQARGVDPEKYRQKDRARYAKNPDRKKEQCALYRQRNPEARKRTNIAYYQKHKPARIAQAISWGNANPDRKREISRNVSRRKRSVPEFRIRQAISAYIYWCLKKKKNGRKWEELVGFTLSELTLHLERQFLKGMSWNNYGTDWHIDHIIPASSFKYETPEDEQFKACWHLTNLRPLWADDNIRKRNKRLFLL